jgi:cytochrome P450
MGEPPEARERYLRECLAVFSELWEQREGKATDSLDFVTAMANSAAYKGMAPLEYLGTLVLLIVGGNDTSGI